VDARLALGEHASLIESVVLLALTGHPLCSGSPNLCSIRRLPGHPCESDASGSGGRRRASLCAPRPRGPKRPYPCWSAFRCSRAYRPLASGGHRGSRRWPPPSPVPRLRHDRRFSSSVATQAATWPRARSQASVWEPDRADGGVALVLVTARSPAQSAGRAGRELQRAGVGPTRRPGLRTPGCPPSPQSCHQDGTAAWS
jgi:hypothetical protein